jgi:hypothetical protein
VNAVSESGVDTERPRFAGVLARVLVTYLHTHAVLDLAHGGT